MLFFLYMWILIIHLFRETASFCILPEQFQNSVWIDSDKGELKFSTTNMTGWEFQTNNGDLFEDWECLHTSTDSTKLLLIMVNKSKESATRDNTDSRTICMHVAPNAVDMVNIVRAKMQTQNIRILGATYTAYLCMELTEITSQSYYYYLLWAEEEKYRYERISTTLSSTVVSDPVQQLCFSTENASQAAYFPETGEYHILVKQGSEVSAKQECPSTFFGEYFYIVKDLESKSSYCGTGNEVWDVCTDYERMTFNYTVCDTKISYSGNGSVFCVFSLTFGSYTYHTLYNEDNFVNHLSGTYRFTCMVSSRNSDGSLNVSQTPGSCRKGQTPTEQPVFASNNSSAGLNMQLTPRKLCPKRAEGPCNGLSAAAIAGIVIGTLVLTIIIINVIVCLKGKCCRERRIFKQKKNISSEHDTSKIISEKVVNEEPRNQTSKEKLYINNDIQTTLSSNAESATQGESLKDEDERSQFNNEDMFDLALEMSRPDHRKSGQMSTSTINSDKNTTECTQEDIILGKCSVPSIANQAFNGNVSCESKLTDDIVEPLDSNHAENIIENKSDEIVVTRITKNEEPLRKDMPHLNSTENIFSDFDATVTHETENYSISKSDLSINILCVETKNNQKNVIVFSRDDSALDMETDNKTMSKNKTQERMHKSEGNLVDAIEKGNSTRITSKISYDPLEWNFVYRSPYALSDKQKQDIIDKKVKLKKKKEQMKKLKQKEKEKRVQENQVAFEKWKQSKMKTTTAKNKSLENVSERAESTFWYPT